MGFAILLILFACIAAFLQSPIGKGIVGEFVIKLLVGKPSKEEGKEKLIIHNLLLESEPGKTSQTDHVVILPEGVFVIETKNYSGRIYGNDTQREWTQVLNYGKVKNHFYSPVKQNATHVYRIKELLPQDTPIYSAVVFVKGNISFIKSEYVYTPWTLFQRLKAGKEQVLTLAEMEKIYAILTEQNKSKEISNFEHVQNIQNTQDDIRHNICPRCHGTLVIRSGKNGVFRGCSNYPKCKFTKKL